MILVAAFPEVREIGKHVAKALHATFTEIAVHDFPDSELHVQLNKNPGKKTVVILNSMAGDPNTKVVETILAAGVARDYKAQKVILVATYLPYMRQDTHFKKYDSFSSKQILRLLNVFDHIIALDPHLHRIKKMHEISWKAEAVSVNSLVANYIQKRFKGDFTIIGPDEESQQWSETIAQMLGKKVVILKKERFSSTHVTISEKKLGKNLIIIDDIISTGKTLAAALQMARKQHAGKLICLGIHGVLVNGADKLITKYAELITTNTIPNRYAKIDVSPVIVDALKKHLR